MKAPTPHVLPPGEWAQTEARSSTTPWIERAVEVVPAAALGGAVALTLVCTFWPQPDLFPAAILGGSAAGAVMAYAVGTSVRTRTLKTRQTGHARR